MRRLLLILLFGPVLLCGRSLPVLAEDSIVLRGFGTLGISCFNENNADYTYNTLPNGPGRSRRCDSGLDSVLGGQLDATLSDTLNSVVQVTSQHNPNNNYSPELSLAHLRWQPNNGLMIRLGRVSNPLFLYSDYRLVHFSLPTIRPPSELYGLAPFYTMDGVDGFYRYRLQDWRVEYYAGYQSSNFSVPLSNSAEVDTAKFRDVITLSTSAERGAWLYRAGYSQGKVSYATSQTDMLFNVLGSISPALTSQLELLDVATHVYTLALRYDDSDWLLQTEIARNTFDKSYYRNGNAAYLTIGCHLGPWMPYGTLARRKTYGPDSDSRAGPLLAQVGGLLAATRLDQSSLALGASREIGKSTVIKGQVEWLQPDRGSYGNSLTNPAPNFNLANPPLDRLLSVNLDFAF